MLKKYRTCNPTVRFLKYKFNNKLLGDVILLKITRGVTWTQSYIYIYIYIVGMYKWVSLFMYELYNNEISIWWVLI